MTGGVLDHIERVQDGKPLYTEPTDEWIPFIYTPGYYWVAAAAARLFPLVFAARLVSIACTVLAAWSAAALAGLLGATRGWRVLAAALFVSCFTFTSSWYDIERSDSLFVAMLGWGAYCAIRWPSAKGAALAGAITGAAFFVKQPATIFVAFAVAAFAISRSWRRLFAFLAGAALLFLPTFALLQHRTHGWFSYYCLTLPASHGLDSRLVTLFLVVDQSKAFLFTLATFVALALFVPWRPEPATQKRFLFVPATPRLVFAAYLAASWAASAASRMHVGGFPNVLMFWTLFASVAIAVLACEFEQKCATNPLARWILHGVIACQVLRFADDPTESIPEPGAIEAADRLRLRVAEYEAKGGEVLVYGRGHVSKVRHFHSAALVDVLRQGGPLPRAVHEAFAGQKYAAVVIDDINDLTYQFVRPRDVLARRTAPFEVIVRNYFVAERLEYAPFPVVGHRTRPTYVLLPRERRLESLSYEALEARGRIELALADGRRWLKDAHGVLPEETIERAAEGAVSAH